MDNTNVSASPSVQPTANNTQQTPPPSATSGSDKKRGAFLTIMLVLMALGIVQTFYQLVNPVSINPAAGSIAKVDIINMGLGLMILQVGSLVTGAVTVVGLWLWKKWAAYLYGISLAISIITIPISQKLILTNQAIANFGLFLYLFPLGMGALFFWAISRKWSSFE